MAFDPSVHTQLRLSIHRSNLQLKEIHRIFAVFCHGDKKTPNFYFNYLYKKPRFLKTKVKSVNIAKALKRRLNF